MARSTSVRCLILACGNTLRGDDGVGPWLAAWAENRFRNQKGLRVISRHQWTPELAEDLCRAEMAIFIDCSIDSPPGSVNLIEIGPNPQAVTPVTHHLCAPELLALARHLYNNLPRKTLQLTIGAGSVTLGGEFSKPVTDALDQARTRLEQAVSEHLQATGTPEP